MYVFTISAVEILLKVILRFHNSSKLFSYQYKFLSVPFHKKNYLRARSNVKILKFHLIIDNSVGDFSPFFFKVL